MRRESEKEEEKSTLILQGLQNVPMKLSPPSKEGRKNTGHIPPMCAGLSSQQVSRTVHRRLESLYTHTHTYARKNARHPRSTCTTNHTGQKKQLTYLGEGGGDKIPQESCQRVDAVIKGKHTSGITAIDHSNGIVAQRDTATVQQICS